ncbi:MAG: lipopolysaccharide heptosyltransferase II [Candidatus Omnitrophica bacterium]|nr:lipopolysaccharide heptosyltransferase II [Candidatus Omnitrophota bacterium]MDD5077498.1 lipopolysaccharide heptosyltransferase II [Candidatus Omnitrophota bacterium]MDD5724936.1 lipopolysaccharide heptosyltransferase II [Candidatus Omnitrophota bacterium]
MDHKTEAGRILIFNVNWLGDVLFSTAVIRNVRRNYPESYLACAIPSRCYPVLKDNPYLDEVIIFDEKDRHRGMLGRLDFVSFLKKRRFDTVFLLHRSFSRALICRLAGIKQRIGHHTRKRAFLLTENIVPPDRDSLHRIDYYLDVIEKAGLRVEDRFLDFYFSPSDEDKVDDFFKRNALGAEGPVVAVNPGGNWIPKRWPPDYWAELSDGLIEKTGAKVVVTGSISDLQLAGQIRDKMKHTPLVACGVFNIKQLGALAKKADLFISADTGPLHIANAVGAKKIIALFGPTDRKITGPYPATNVVLLQKDVGCPVPCYKVRCPESRCMRALTPGEVLLEARKALEK